MKKKKEDQDLLEWAKEFLRTLTGGFRHYDDDPDDTDEFEDEIDAGHYPGSDDIYTIGRDDQEEEEDKKEEENGEEEDKIKCE